jgi:hypothetical protein
VHKSVIFEGTFMSNDKKSVRFVAEFYGIDEQAAQELFSDEIQAYEQILEMGLDQVCELLEAQK